MRLVLVRHAEASRGKGITDDGLTDAGRAQVRRLARYLRATGELEDCRVLLSSPLRRANETATLLRTKLQLPEICIDPDLAEIGEHADAPEEGVTEGFARVRALMDAMAAQYRDRTVVAVTHAGVIMASVRVRFDIPTPGTGARLEPTHVSLTTWRVIDRLWQLDSYNVPPLSDDA